MISQSAACVLMHVSVHTAICSNANNFAGSWSRMLRLTAGPCPETLEIHLNECPVHVINVAHPLRLETEKSFLMQSTDFIKNHKTEPARQRPSSSPGPHIACGLESPCSPPARQFLNISVTRATFGCIAAPSCQPLTGNGFQNMRRQGI